MNKLINVIEQNHVQYNKLGNSEVITLQVNELFDQDIIEYLKEHYRFDYKGICIYYVERTNEIWIENMNA